MEKNPTKEPEWELLIIPCRGESSLARLAVTAAVELSKRNGVRVLGAEESGERLAVKAALGCSDRTITVDGCVRQCMLKQLASLQAETEFHLILSELGIEDRDDAPLSPDDLDLARDAIVAAATRISSLHPRIPGCSCR